MNLRRPTSRTWDELLAKFCKYGNLPTWGWFFIAPDEETLQFTKENLEKLQERGRKMNARAAYSYRKLAARRPILLPSSPQGLPDMIEKLWREAPKVVGKQRLKNFWDAVIFDYDNYTCYHCGRNTFEVYKEENGRRGLFLIVDHLAPRIDVGLRSPFTNLVTACWSCNTLKGRLPVQAFQAELASLVKNCCRTPFSA